MKRSRSSIITDSDIESTDSEIENSRIATINCSGRNKRRKNSDNEREKIKSVRENAKGVTKNSVRYELLKSTLEAGFDIICLQEIPAAIGHEIKEKLADTHYFARLLPTNEYICQAGILVKKDTFCDFKSSVKSFKDDADNKIKEIERLVFAAAKLKDSNEIILIASYHGPYKVLKTDKRNHFEKCYKIMLGRKTKDES